MNGGVLEKNEREETGFASKYTLHLVFVGHNVSRNVGTRRENSRSHPGVVIWGCCVAVETSEEGIM